MRYVRSGIFRPPTSRRLWLPAGDPPAAPRPARLPRLWLPRRPMWRPRPDLLNLAGIQVSSAGVKVKSGGVVEADSGRTCCCQDPSPLSCFTKFTITWSCINSTWGAWTPVLNSCSDPATVNTARTRTSGSSYQQWVQAAGPVSCTTDGDCSGHTAATPATPTDTPTDATGTDCAACGCSHTVPFHVTVTIAGTALQTACFAAADNSGSFIGVGTGNGTFTLKRDAGNVCIWQVTLGPGFPDEMGNATTSPVILHRDCFSNTCVNNGGGLDSVAQRLNVKLARSAANTWRITAFVEGAAGIYDSGNFTWNDQDACDGVGSGAHATISPGVTLATGCNPSWAASGGTGSASF